MNRGAVEERILRSLNRKWNPATGVQPAVTADFAWADARRLYAAFDLFEPLDLSFEGVADLAGIPVADQRSIRIVPQVPVYMLLKTDFRPDAAGGVPARLISGPMLDEYSGAWASPTGRQVLLRSGGDYGDYDSVPKMWLYEVGDLEPRLIGDWPAAPPHAVAWMPDGSGYLIGSHFFVPDVPDGRPAAQLDERALAAAVSPDGLAAVAVADWTGGSTPKLDIVIWNLVTGERQAFRGVMNALTEDGYISPLNIRWQAASACGGPPCLVDLWHTYRNQGINLDVTTSDVRALAGGAPQATPGSYFSPDGTRVLTLIKREGQWNHFWALHDSSGANTEQIYIKGDFPAPVWAPDSSKFAFTDELVVYDRDGAHLWSAGPGVRHVAGWDAETGGILYFAAVRPLPTRPPGSGSVYDGLRDCVTEEEITLTEQLQAWVSRVRAEAGAHVIPMGNGYKLVLISRGHKPTAGYEVHIDKWSTTPGSLTIFVSYADPRPGDPVAQVITYPTTLIAVKDDGRVLEVRDASNGSALIPIR